jgi:SMI1 / KNR4 family (SUKH-1)
MMPQVDAPERTPAVQEITRMANVFDDFDIEQFWDPSEYANQEYVGVPYTEEVVRVLKRELGYQLPSSYLELMRYQNGGIPRNRNHRTAEPTSWASDHIAIQGIFSIGREPSNSLGGVFRTQFWIDEWGYPAIGVYFADCPSAGHDMVCLDYRECGPSGDPQVVHIDQEWDYKITFVAESFEAFIRGLESNEAFEQEV